MSTTKTFVCGATGTQGGALALQLLSQKQNVNFLARDPQSPKAKHLTSLGAKAFEGDYANTTALTSAIEGCTTVFMNFSPTFQDLSLELHYAKTVIKIAEDASVKHIIYSSGFGLDDPTRFRQLDPESIMGKVFSSKTNIEAACKSTNIPRWTILRPGHLMKNFLPPLVLGMSPGLVAEEGVWKVAFRPTTRLPFTDDLTMGRFTAAAVLGPERFGGKEITYADELLTPTEAVARVAAVTGREELRVEYMTDEEIEAQKAANPYVIAQVCGRQMEDLVDMEEVKGWGIELSTLDDFLRRNADVLKDTFCGSTSTV